MINFLRRFPIPSLALLLLVLFGMAIVLSFEPVPLNASDGGTQRALERINGNWISQATPAADAPNATFVFITFAAPTATRTPTPVNFGNFVWDDYDQDGRQDAGEPGLPGITVQLWNSTKTALIDSTVTNASGNYTLTSSGPGDYRIRVLLPSGDSFSPKDQAGGDDLLDSDINPSGTNFGFTSIYTIASNVISIVSIDAGIIKFRTATPTRTPTPINVGNFVWNDLNSNGIQDAGEPGLNGVTVQLWNAAKNNLFGSTTTNQYGNYTLVAPLPGDYRVRVILPGGALFSPKDAGANDQIDSDINPSGGNAGFTDIYNFSSSLISITTIDAGIRNVSATPTFTPSPTPDPFAGTVDTIALFSKAKQKLSLLDSLQDQPPGSAFTNYKANAPANGKQFTMGDWNADGQKTPGLYDKNGNFWYTNDIGASATWLQVGFGLTGGKYALVSGRFSASVTHDCVGIVHINANAPDTGFPLYYTCELVAVPPSGIQTQFLAAVIATQSGKYEFAAGDFNNDGLDSLAVRRGRTIIWTNVAPAQGLGAFYATQDFGKPFDGGSKVLAGDWNADGIDTFALYYPAKSRMFYRNDLNSSYIAPIRQRFKNKAGDQVLVDSWRDVNGMRSDGVLLLPPAPQAAVTLTPIPSYSVEELPTLALDTAVPPLPTDTPPMVLPTDTPYPTFMPTRTEVALDEAGQPTP